MDIASRAGLLHETAEHHDPYEKTHAPHNWWDWYAAYMDAREHGSTPDEASQAAGRYMEEVLRIAPSEPRPPRAGQDVGVEPLLEGRAGERGVRARQQGPAQVELVVRVVCVHRALDPQPVAAPRHSSFAISTRLSSRGPAISEIVAAGSRSVARSATRSATLLVLAAIVITTHVAVANVAYS